MKLLINGKEEIVSHEGETLDDLLNFMEREYLAKGNVVRSIKLDGQESSLDSSEVR
ncbi:uncharacterized protein METZ01_LOCUS210289, partial [marine metagenome]